MGVPEALTSPAGDAPGARAEVCPRCGEPAPTLPPLSCATLRRDAVRRCTRCATRWAEVPPGREFVFGCETCGLPFASATLLAHGEQRCAGCRDGIVPPELPDARVSEAVEHEIRASLDGRWRFGTASSGQAYLDRVARQVAGRSEGAPEGVRVVVIDAAVHRTLALPGGTLLVSSGTLVFLEDEAELAFVLGHEIAHAASGDAAVRLSRMGFLASSSSGDRDGAAWADAACDLVILGYGRHRERDADARAILAMGALGYDTRAAGRYLDRLEAAMEAGDPAVAETAVAHPTPSDRKRRLAKLLYGRISESEGALKVNREVFRRAVPQDFGATLARIRLGAEGRTGSLAFTPLEPSGTRLPWAVLAAALGAVSLLALAAWWLF